MARRYTAVLTTNGNLTLASNPETGIYVGGTDRDSALETLRQQLEIRERTQAAGPYTNEADLPTVGPRDLEIVDARER